MSEMQAGQQPVETSTEPAGIAWGDPISPERLAELKELFERQKEWAAQPIRDINQSAFKGVKLTGTDIFWLTAIAIAGPEGNLEAAKTRLDIAVSTLTFTQIESIEVLHLDGASLHKAQLAGAYLRGAHLVGADLRGANLSKANLFGVRLEGADLFQALIEGAYLRLASFDKASRLNDAKLNGAYLDQVIFDNTNLAVIHWEAVKSLGDEHRARATSGASSKAALFHLAARAYRSLSVALRNQGLSADATRFHYRAELMERKSSWWQIWARLRTKRFYTAPTYFGRWLFSWLLGTFAGYGDYFGRLLLTYLLVVSAFAGAMFLAAGRIVSFDAIRDVFVLSITSFHGRGVQPPGLTMTDTLATLTAVEAFFGLLIEGIFIAAFTRRVTGN